MKPAEESVGFCHSFFPPLDTTWVEAAEGESITTFDVVGRVDACRVDV